jgi:hypothetical protein
VPESGAGGGDAMVIVTTFERVVAPSVTEIVALNVPDVVGVPEITPPRSVSSAGSEPLVIDHIF